MMSFISLNADMAMKINPIYLVISLNFVPYFDDLFETFARAGLKLNHRVMVLKDRYVGPYVPRRYC